MPSIEFLYLIMLVLAGSLVLLRGDQWARLVWAILLIAWMVSWLMPFNRVEPPWGIITVDCLVFLTLLYCWLRSGRLWLIFAATFQFLVLATHYVFVRNQDLMQWAYVSAYYVWNIGLVVSLSLGSLRADRRGKYVSDEKTGTVPNVEPRRDA